MKNITRWKKVESRSLILNTLIDIQEQYKKNNRKNSISLASIFLLANLSTRLSVELWFRSFNLCFLKSIRRSIFQN